MNSNFSKIITNVTKYFYVVLGIILVALLVPNGLALLNVNLPSLFSYVNDPLFVNILNISSIVIKIFLLITLLSSFILMFVFIKKSQSKAIIRLACFFSLIIPCFYFMRDFFAFMEPVTNYLNNDIFKFAITSFSLSMLLFLTSIVLYCLKDKHKEYKLNGFDILNFFFLFLFNLFYLVAYKNIFSFFQIELLIVIENFYIPAYALTIGLFRIITESKKFKALKNR